jgi:hypothetical protein
MNRRVGHRRENGDRGGTAFRIARGRTFVGVPSVQNAVPADASAATIAGILTAQAARGSAEPAMLIFRRGSV